MNFAEVMPCFRAAAAIRRFSIAASRMDVGASLIAMATTNVVTLGKCQLACILERNESGQKPAPGNEFRALASRWVRMRVRMTQTIADDSDMHISLVINVSRCQPSTRFEPRLTQPMFEGQQLTDLHSESRQQLPL